MYDDSWRRSYNGKVPAFDASAAPKSAAPTAAGQDFSKATVAGACTFMMANPGISFEEKKAFLLEKGVPAFVIAQAACTAPDAAIVL
jgi:hypothetical protein